MARDRLLITTMHDGFVKARASSLTMPFAPIFQEESVSRLEGIAETPLLHSIPEKENPLMHSFPHRLFDVQETGYLTCKDGDDVMVLSRTMPVD